MPCSPRPGAPASYPGIPEQKQTTVRPPAQLRSGGTTTPDPSPHQSQGRTPGSVLGAPESAPPPVLLGPLHDFHARARQHLSDNPAALASRLELSHQLTELLRGHASQQTAGGLRVH